MAKKIIIKHGIQYRDKVNNRIFTLREDYNGSWYLACRNEEGLHKTLSQSKNHIYEVLEKDYERI